MSNNGKNTASVTVTVNKFHKIGGDHSFSDADIQLTDGGGIASQSAINDPIVVTGAGDIVFHLQAKQGANDNYIPVGIGFKQGASSDPLGVVAFPARTIAASSTETTLTLNDADPEQNSFEFGLVIERVSDGSLSVVDPEISNDPK